jgi:hypothetical protein
MRISGPALLIAVLAAACSTASLTLPTDPGWHDPAGGCRGVGLDGILRGSANDARVLWMEDRATGERVELIWPAGYHARDDFGLEVLDDSGTFVGKEGDLVTGACITGAPGEAMHVWAGELKAAP